MRMEITICIHHGSGMGRLSHTNKHKNTNRGGISQGAFLIFDNVYTFLKKVFAQKNVKYL